MCTASFKDHRQLDLLGRKQGDHDSNLETRSPPQRGHPPDPIHPDTPSAIFSPGQYP